MSSTPILRFNFDRKSILHEGVPKTLCTFEVMYADLEDNASIVPRTMKSVAFLEENMSQNELGLMLIAMGNEFIDQTQLPAADEDAATNG